jgi:chromosomal replication initiation ATPase DnaA
MRATLSEAEARRRCIVIAARFALTFEEMASKNRFRMHVQARRECYALLRSHDWSLERIGKFMGGRDHTSIGWALGEHQKQYGRGA